MAVLLGVPKVGMPNSGISGRLCWAMFSPPPSSKKAVIEQARRSMWSVVNRSLKRRNLATIPVRKLTSSKKQKPKKQEKARFRVEIPLGNQSDAALAVLLLILLEDARVKNTGKVCVVLRSESMLEAVLEEIENEENQFRVLPELQLASLEDGEDFEPDEDVSLVLFVAPGASDLESRLKRFVVNCGKGGRVLVLLNPDWNSQDEDKDQALCDSFQVVYAYSPLDIKVFIFSLIKGAVFKQELEEPWRVFLKEQDTMKCMLSMQRRPMEKDLEPIFYNFLAANSLPVKVVKFVKEIFQKGAKKSP